MVYPEPWPPTDPPPPSVLPVYKLGAAGSAGYGLLILALTLLVCALALVGTGVNWLAALVGVPALVLLYLGLALVFNRTAITVSREWITASPTGMPDPTQRTVRVSARNVAQVYIEHERASETAKPFYHLVVQYADLSKKVLVKDFDDLDQLRGAERALEKALKPGGKSSGLDLDGPRRSRDAVKEYLRAGRGRPK